MDKVEINNHQLKTLVALTDEEKITGLSHQQWPPPIMSFIFDDAKYRKFWMKNTPSPLDIIFCRGGKIISIEPGEPFSLAQIGPDELCDLVIEVPAGLCCDLGIKKGHLIKLNLSLTTLAKKFGLLLSKIG